MRPVTPFMITPRRLVVIVLAPLFLLLAVRVAVWPTSPDVLKWQTPAPPATPSADRRRESTAGSCCRRWHRDRDARPEMPALRLPAYRQSRRHNGGRCARHG